MTSLNPLLRYVVAGKFNRDYLVFPDGRVYNDIKGGNILYSAAGLRLWDSNIGLLGIACEDYPVEWLHEAEKQGFDIRGVQVISNHFDQRRFIAYPLLDKPDFKNPIGHYSRINKPFPKTLLGYSELVESGKSEDQKISLRIKDIPFDYLDVSAVHIASMEYELQTRLPTFFRQGHATTITLQASDQYMNSVDGNVVPSILKDINAFICSEAQIRALFLGKTSNIWDMVSALDIFGCEIIVILTNNNSFLLWEHSTKRKYEIPFYPTKIVDPTGLMDSFCGGFISGLRSIQNPLKATMQGVISSSFTVEGIGPFYCLEALPQLVSARLETLSNYIKVI